MEAVVVASMGSPPIHFSAPSRATPSLPPSALENASFHCSFGLNTLTWHSRTTQVTFNQILNRLYGGLTPYRCDCGKQLMTTTMTMMSWEAGERISGYNCHS